jgi:hypothetical protein
MNLDDAQKQKVAGWLEEGLKLSDIQKKIISEFGLTMTYMEVRFLLDDLKLKPKEKELPPSPPVQIGKAAASAQPGRAPAQTPEKPATQPAPSGPANVSVTVDQVTRPGALVSGNVTFSDGNSAQWYLDQTGRLGVAAKQQGYRPSENDVMAFQTELQNQLAKLGY